MDSTTPSTFNLNPHQEQAVMHGKGPLLVISGAGSGKTRVITSRIARLLEQGAHPSQIIALTFTNKAAREMLERIQKMLGANYSELPFIGTFHSYCLRLLKTNSHLLEHPFITLLDQDDQEKLIKDIASRYSNDKKINVKQILHQISQLKNSGQPLSSLTTAHAKASILQIYQIYEEEKSTSRSLDFDDLLLHACKLFTNQQFKRRFQSSICHVLVDEYQDTNAVQHMLLKHMTLDSNKQCAIESVCAVGDEDQSIYSWRGATVANMLDFAQDFPSTTIIKIEQNYRSAQPILQTANHVISFNTGRNPKNLWSTRTGTERVKVIRCNSEYQEADGVVQFIKNYKRKYPARSVAVLYRSHFQSRAIEEALVRQSISYSMIGGVQFYERKEIKDILAYLRLVINPYDRVSWSRILNVPARGLGAKFEELWNSIWLQEPLCTFTEIANILKTRKLVTGQKLSAMQTLVDIFTGINPITQPSIVIEDLINRTDYIAYLYQEYDTQDAQARAQNVKEFIAAVKYIEQSRTLSIEQLLYEITLMQEQSATQEKELPTVTLMTIHAAKGLEFDAIMLIGLEEGILPSTRARTDDNAIEEERRLLYVGITRAKEHLLMTHSRYRYTYGVMAEQIPSRFIEELPAHSVQSADGLYWNGSSFDHFIQEWMMRSEHNRTQNITFSTPVSPQNLSTQASSPTTTIKTGSKVRHRLFGMGTVQEIEERADSKKYAIVLFSSGLKKVDCAFLELN
jgi:DNA helicase-2/ATP-dependent DNA helicase PcrA